MSSPYSITSPCEDVQSALAYWVSCLIDPFIICMSGLLPAAQPAADRVQFKFFVICSNLFALYFCFCLLSCREKTPAEGRVSAVVDEIDQRLFLFCGLFLFFFYLCWPLGSHGWCYSLQFKPCSDPDWGTHGLFKHIIFKSSFQVYTSINTRRLQMHYSHPLQSN